VGGTHGLVQLLIICIVVGAIFYLVDQFAPIPAQMKTVIKVIAGVILLIFAIRILAAMAGI
jgi:uncharacterized protein YhhL (DUF1145 family)